MFNTRCITKIIFPIGIFLCNTLAAQENVRFVAVLEPVGNNGVTALNKLSVRGTMEEFITKSMEYKGVDRVRTNQILMEHSFQRNGMVDSNKVKEIGLILGADLVCVSELHNEGGYINITISLIDVKSGVLDGVRNRIMVGENPLVVQSLVEKMASDLLCESHKQRQASEKQERERLAREYMETEKLWREMRSESAKTAKKEVDVKTSMEESAKSDQNDNNKPAVEVPIKTQHTKFQFAACALTNTTFGFKNLIDDTKISPVNVGIAVFGRWRTVGEAISIRTDLDLNTYRTNHNYEKNKITRYALKGGLVYFPSKNGFYFCIQSGISLWDIKQTKLVSKKPGPKPGPTELQKNSDNFSKYVGAALFGAERRIFGKSGILGLMECGVDFNFLDKNETVVKEFNGFKPAMLIKFGLLW